MAVTRISTLLLVEGASFAAASLVHRGVLVGGHEHAKAAVAETVIGAVLLAGLVLVRTWPGRARAIGLTAQGFALAGTIVGVVMVAIGVGPRTVPDVAYHVSILALIVVGLTLTARPRAARRAGDAAVPVRR